MNINYHYLMYLNHKVMDIYTIYDVQFFFYLLINQLLPNNNLKFNINIININIINLFKIIYFQIYELYLNINTLNNNLSI